MEIRRIEFANNGEGQGACMGNFVLVSPNGKHTMEIIYEGEPPHGDSYHKANIDGRPFPGLVWGCIFAFTPCSRYVAFSWMEKPIERRTIVVDLEKQLRFLLPVYIYEFSFTWPSITGKGLSAGINYMFNGREEWRSY